MVGGEGAAEVLKRRKGEVSAGGGVIWGERRCPQKEGARGR